MHGIGYQWAVRAFETFGHCPFLPVASQQLPDPEFPTVSFPNPEEKGLSFFFNILIKLYAITIPSVDKDISGC